MPCDEEPTAVTALTSQPRVGFVGAGQLARMTASDAVALDVRLRVLAPDAGDSAARVLRDVVVGSHRDLDALRGFAAGCDVVTFDHELTDPADLQALAGEGHLLRPSPAAERYAQDKWHQRTSFARLGLPVPAHARAETAADVRAFGDEQGWPVVVKAVRGGYDGRGVWVLPDAAAVDELWPDAAASGAGLLVEAFVPIVRELAVLVARRPGGQTVTYPIVETVQVDGICRELVVPAGAGAATLAAAEELGLRIAEAVDVTGILAVELFDTAAGLVINEVALRPHNSGHWTIDGARTSQFANHLRAVLDWPLGAVEMTAPAVVTVNLLGVDDGGDPRAGVPAALAVPGVAVHLYGKVSRPGRKLGHVTATGSDVAEARRLARQAARLMGTEAHW